MPSLDDRDFEQLVEDARKLIPQLCPQWTNLGPGDPGIVLVELFAYLTDALIYRLNRVPEKVYVALLRLMGVKLEPPAAAGVTLRFSRARPGEELLEIPRDTRVKPQRSGPGPLPTFSTVRAVRIEPGSDEVFVRGYDCEWAGGDDGEAVGVGTGLAGQSVQASRAPIAVTSADEPSILVGVEVGEGEDVSGEIRLAGGRQFRIWQEVDSFADLGDDLHAYTADRMTGLVTFAPAARLVDPDTSELQSVPRPLAEVPRPDREIRLWYRVGGGSRGNVAANTLRVLQDPIPGVEVDNPEAATGGRDAEELANAVVRGPHEFRTLQRVVTARDFEQLASRSHGAVARAKAYAKAAIWSFARPGTVEVLLVPTVPGIRPGDPVTRQQIEAQQTEDAIHRVRSELDSRRPLGTACEVKWAHYKEVAVHAKVVARRAENVQALQGRIMARLHGEISPLPNPPEYGGWPFGETLHVSRAYGIIMSEPGVHHVRGQVRLVVGESPDREVAALAADASRQGTWYAGSDDTVFRSDNDGSGWEMIGRFSEERTARICSHPSIGGLVAVLAHRGEERHSRVYLSPDCGESWIARPLADFAFEVEDIAWLPGRDDPRLMLATTEGLYEARPGQPPVRVEVERENPGLEFYAVTTTTDPAGRVYVAVAAQDSKGVFVSDEGGRTGTFRNIGLVGHDLRVLATQVVGSRRLLWAGEAAIGQEVGAGCHCWDLTNPAAGWRTFGDGWKGGSCNDLAFHGTQVLAATFSAGVLRLDTADASPSWTTPEIGCGLPLRADVETLDRVLAVAASDGPPPVVVAGGPRGVFREEAAGHLRFENCSTREFVDQVTLPGTSTFCSGEHIVDVVTEDGTQAD
jgi:hypothetical protein